MKITVKAARVNVGLTQKEAAEKLGISRHSLIGYEKKPDKIPYVIAEEMSKVYEISKEELIFLQKKSALSGEAMGCAFSKTG